MSVKGNRITLEDSFLEAMTKMSDGNPGALTVLMEMCKDDPVEGLMTILHLDSQHIYGSQIWIQYKDVYNYDIAKFIEDTKSYKLKIREY